MSEELEPLDPKLAAMVADERSRPAAEDAGEAAARALRRFELQVALREAPPREGGRAAVPRGPRRTAIRAAILLAAALSAGAVLGAVGHSVLAPPRSLELPPPSATTPQTSTPPPVSMTAPPVSAAPSVSIAPANLPASVAPPVLLVPSASGSSAPTTLGAERQLIEVARTALDRNDPASALTQLRAHAARYPQGLLAEERDALIIQAFALEGQTSEARARLRAFKKSYPRSLFLPAIGRVLDGGTAD